MGALPPWLGEDGATRREHLIDDRAVDVRAVDVEVVQAQQTVEQADNDLISATYEHNLAKAALARALGQAEKTIPQYLKGK